MIRTKGDDTSKNLNYDYDRDGYRTKDEKGTYDFNARGQMTWWKRSGRYDSAAGTTVTYTLGGSGQIRSKVDGKGPGTTRTTFSYDGPQLQSATTDGVKASYDYNTAGQVTKISNPGGSLKYSYDAAGRLTKANAPGKDDDATYSYDALDRKDAKREDGKLRHIAYPGLDKNLIADISASTKAGVKSRYYDTGASGQRYNLQTVTRKAAKKKKSKSKSKGKKKSGKKKSGKKKSGKKSSYDHLQSIAEGQTEVSGQSTGDDAPTPDPAATITNLTEASAALDSSGAMASAASSSSTSKSELKVLATDVQGGVEGIEQPDGSVNAKDLYDLDPYGALENESKLSAEAKNNEVRFQGFAYDDSSELYDMQARSYRPQVARFMSRDRYESSALDFNLEADPLTGDLYSFAGGNPVNNVEWDGHRVKCTDFVGQRVCNDDGKPGKNDVTKKGDYLVNTGKPLTNKQANALKYNAPGNQQAVGYVRPLVPAPTPIKPPSPLAPTFGNAIEHIAAHGLPGDPGGQSSQLFVGDAMRAAGYAGAFWEGASRGMTIRASTLGSMLNPYSGASVDARSAAGRYLAAAGRSRRWGWVRAGEYSLRGVRVLPIAGAAADFSGDKFVDNRGWLDASLHTGAKVVGGSIGVFVGGVGCASETVATAGAGVVACPVLVAGGTLIGAEASGRGYDYLRELALGK